VNILMTKGQLDWFPNWLAYCAVAASPVIWLILGLTHDGFKGYVRRTNRRMALSIFILIGALIGGMIGWGIYALQTRSVRIAETKSSSPSPTLTGRDKVTLADTIAGPAPRQRPKVGDEQLFTKPTFSAAKTCRFKVFGYVNDTDFDIESLKVQEQPLKFNEEPMALRPVAAASIGPDGILRVDATTYGGVVIYDNHYSKLPDGWDTNWNDFAFEIVNEKQVPMYSVRLLRPTLVELRGILMLGSGQMIAVPAEGGMYGCKLIKLDHSGDAPPPGTIPEYARRIFKYPGQLNRGVLEEDEKLKLPW